MPKADRYRLSYRIGRTQYIQRCRLYISFCCLFTATKREVEEFKQGGSPVQFLFFSCAPLNTACHNPFTASASVPQTKDASDDNKNPST